MRILLITATDIETRVILEQFKPSGMDAVQTQHGGNQTYYDFGIIGGCQVLLVQSEMGAGGLSGSLLTVDEGIREWSPSVVIMVGIAFGMDPRKQKIGDILVSKQIQPYELQRIGTTETGEEAIVSRGPRVDVPPRPLNRFRGGEKTWSGAPVHFGLLVSGEKLVDNLLFRQSLSQQSPEAIGGEMEGAGLYAAAERHKTDWIIVKAICDWADGDKQKNKSQRQRKAIQNAATFTLHVLNQGGFAASTNVRNQHSAAQPTIEKQPHGAARPKNRTMEAELRSIEKQLQIVKESKLVHEEQYRRTQNPQLLVMIGGFDKDIADLEQRQRDLES